MWDSTVENNVREILGGVYYRRNPAHHLGHPFLTAYQLAIEYDDHFPELREELGYPIGGRDSGEHRSLTSWLADNLSRRIDSGSIADIQRGFLSDRRIFHIAFDGPDEIIRASVRDISVFPLLRDDTERDDADID